MNRKTRIILAAVVLLALFGYRTFIERSKTSPPPAKRRSRPSAATSCFVR